MYRIIKTELWKLKRYHIIWAGIDDQEYSKIEIT